MNGLYKCMANVGEYSHRWNIWFWQLTFIVGFFREKIKERGILSTAVIL